MSADFTSGLRDCRCSVISFFSPVTHSFIHKLQSLSDGVGEQGKRGGGGEDCVFCSRQIFSLHRQDAAKIIVSFLSSLSRITGEKVMIIKKESSLMHVSSACSADIADKITAHSHILVSVILLTMRREE